MLSRFRLLLLALAIIGSPLFAQAAPRAVVFDFELIDTSAEGDLRGKRADEQQRLALLGDHLRKQLSEKGAYEVVDASPVKAAVAKERALHDCNGCVERIAAPLGVEVAFIGYVQKVSNLILNVNVEIRDVKTGATVKRMSADIRANNDEAWLRGLQYLIDNRLMK